MVGRIGPHSSSVTSLGEREIRGHLSGKVEDNVLNATFRVAKCGTTIIGFLKGLPASLEYDDMGTADAGDDTLWDGSVLWHRDG